MPHNSIIINVPDEPEKIIPIAFEITNSNGQVDFINRKYIMQYLRDYPKFYGDGRSTHSKIVKIRVVNTIDIPLSHLDFSKCTFTKEHVVREILMHRRDLKRLKSLGIIKWFAKDCVFDANPQLDEELKELQA